MVGNDIQQVVDEDEITSVRIAIRARYHQIRDLNRRLVELGEKEEDEPSWDPTSAFTTKPLDPLGT